MTREDILRMAREAEIPVQITGGNATKLQIQRFAALVAAAEREACARLIDEQDSYGDPVYCWFEHLAAAIRARGEK